MNKNIEKKIILTLSNSGKKGVAADKLQKRSNISKKRTSLYKEQLKRLLSELKAVEFHGRIYLAKNIGAFVGVITKNNPKYCFAVEEGTDQKIFIPGRFSQGALLGDKVLLKPIAPRGESKEAKVLSILKYADTAFSGVLCRRENQWKVLPDNLGETPLKVAEICTEPKEGDQVIFKITRRDIKFGEHLCKVIASYGSAQSASACCKALLATQRVRVSFPKQAISQAEELKSSGVMADSDRMDLRDLPIFTIDSADSKDLDDAISIEKTKSGYRLGVHIADVSHYVKQGSPLNKEAFLRGCSIYFANRVIPMLPKQLSNGICSLNPNEDRLCLSVFLKLNKKAELVDFEFTKSVIRSRVKGVYKEVNKLLEGKATDELKQKYAEVLPTLPIFYELYQKRKDIKQERGAPQIITEESKILVDKNGHIVDIKKRVSGEAEGLIEECMLLANEAAAKLALKNHLPFVYRVHEKPAAEKIADLKAMLARFGIDNPEIRPGLKAKALAKLLEDTKDSPLQLIINMQVLRSMSKARYDDKPLGHYALVLSDYAHFTSPIRRYPDLVVHQIISEYLISHSATECKKRFNKIAADSALQSSAAERKAIDIERACVDRYQAEYMSSFLGDSFTGVITSVLPSGFFVSLPNTVEGFVSLISSKEDLYYDGFSVLRNMKTGQKFEIGQTQQVICKSVSVHQGKIDFSLA